MRLDTKGQVSKSSLSIRGHKRQTTYLGNGAGALSNGQGGRLRHRVRLGADFDRGRLRAVGGVAADDLCLGDDGGILVTVLGGAPRVLGLGRSGRVPLVRRGRRVLPVVVGLGRRSRRLPRVSGGGLGGAGAQLDRRGRGRLADDGAHEGGCKDEGLGLHGDGFWERNKGLASVVLLRLGANNNGR